MAGTGGRRQQAGRPPHPTGPTRRTVLGGAALLPLLLASGACSAEGDAGPTSAPSPAIDPDVALRAAAELRIRELAAACAGLAVTEPARSVAATAVRTQHEAHLAALAPAPEPSPSAAATTPPPAVVPTPGMTLAGLLALERAAAAAHAEGARTASPEFAQLLASISASEATHEIALAQ